MVDSILRHIDIIPPGEMAHLTRAAPPVRRPAALHGHDFCEIFWVQNGKLRHHLEAGREDLDEGEVVFIRPGDRHALQALEDETLVVSVSLHPDLLAGLEARHPRLSGRLFWSAGAAPVRVSRDPRQLAELNQAALRLERGTRDRLAAEAFLTPLLARLADEAGALPPDLPDWLARACAAAADPRVFREGAAGFARVAGRAHPHVSRMARRWLGLSPTEYVNARRMEFAARKLAGTGDSIAEIAADCGLPNLSHFHRLFREAHGQTPQAYRRRHQAEVIRP